MPNQSASQTPQTRAEFLRGLGLNSAALMSLYCLGTLTSCNSDSSPTPATTLPVTGLTGNTDPGKGKIDFTLDLTNANYSKLKAAGGFVDVAAIIIANAKGGNYVAIDRFCTHAAGNFTYRLAEDDFLCGAHLSEFNTDGRVKPAQPAKRDAKAYKTSVFTNGNSLQVTE